MTEKFEGLEGFFLLLLLFFICYFGSLPFFPYLLDQVSTACENIYVKFFSFGFLEINSILFSFFFTSKQVRLFAPLWSAWTAGKRKSLAAKRLIYPPAWMRFCWFADSRPFALSERCTWFCLSDGYETLRGDRVTRVAGRVALFFSTEEEIILARVGEKSWLVE